MNQRNEIEVALNLGDLADPAKYTEALEIDREPSDVLLRQLRSMLLIRKAEEKIGDKVISKQIVCPCHLGIGQEATAVGVSRYLRATDRVFGTHRSHSHFLALGAPVESLFAEILGKSTGCSKGMGGSMHLYSEEYGFKGSVPIVAATVSMAVGAALAASMDKKTDRDVGVSFLGDGTTEEGSVHESMNMAAIYNLPMLFVVENNLFSSHMHILLRQKNDSVARYAAVHGLNYEVVDGNDVVAVGKATEKLLKEARNGGKPGFLESVTYRWRGHVGPSEDQDVGLKRSGELKNWKGRDPIRRLVEALEAKKILSKEQYKNMNDDVQKEIETAWVKADQAPYPALEKLSEYVWKQEH